MTKSVNMTGFTNIGGVNFQTGAVRKDPIYGAPTYQVDLEVTSDNKVQKRYYVELVDGPSINYSIQAGDKHAFVSVSCKGGNYKQPNRIWFYSIDGVRITDTPKDDVYELWHCTDTNVNAKRDSVKTHGHMLGPGVVYHEYEITHSEDNDNIKIVGGTNVNVNYTTGFDTFERH